jgi:hypothetical protein
VVGGSNPSGRAKQQSYRRYHFYIFAIHWLERSSAQQEGGLTTIKFDPLGDLLRGDPRYKALLRKLKLPE